jgi:hypothetical protein
MRSFRPLVIDHVSPDQQPKQGKKGEDRNGAS